MLLGGVWLGCGGVRHARGGGWCCGWAGFPVMYSLVSATEPGKKQSGSILLRYRLSEMVSGGKQLTGCCSEALGWVCTGGVWSLRTQ